MWEDRAFSVLRRTSEKTNISLIYVTVPFSKVSSTSFSSFISQVTVLTSHIVQLPTLPTTLINLVITPVGEHLLWAESSAKPFVGIVLFNPHDNPEGSTLSIPEGSGVRKANCLAHSRAVFRSRAGIQVLSAGSKFWAIFKTKVGLKNQRERYTEINTEHHCKKEK